MLTFSHSAHYFFIPMHAPLFTSLRCEFCTQSIFMQRYFFCKKNYQLFCIDAVSACCLSLACLTSPTGSARSRSRSRWRRAVPCATAAFGTQQVACCVVFYTCFVQNFVPVLVHVPVDMHFHCEFHTLNFNEWLWFIRFFDCRLNIDMFTCIHLILYSPWN